MRVVLLLLAVMVATCGQREAGETALGKFAARSAVKAGQYFYAHYRFTHEGYEAVEVAVRVEMSNGYPAALRVKDLSPQEAGSPVEEAVLSSSGCSLAFTGTSSGADGGVYGGELELSGGKASSCCGEMTFVPTVDTSLTFMGEKLTDLTAGQWEQLLGGEGTGPEEPSDGGAGDFDNAQWPKKYYAFDDSTMLLSKTEFLPPEVGKQRKYLMQVVVGGNDGSTYIPPVVHIKQVDNDGEIAEECLSLIYDEDNSFDGSGAGSFSFRYPLLTQEADHVWGFSNMYGANPFFNVGVQFPDGPGKVVSYIAVRAGGDNDNSVPLVLEANVASHNSAWGISDDIVAAFGEDSSCDSLGHNRICVGCISQ